MPWTTSMPRSFTRPVTRSRAWRRSSPRTPRRRSSRARRTALMPHSSERFTVSITARTAGAPSSGCSRGAGRCRRAGRHARRGRRACRVVRRAGRPSTRRSRHRSRLRRRHPPPGGMVPPLTPTSGSGASPAVGCCAWSRTEPGESSRHAARGRASRAGREDGPFAGWLMPIEYEGALAEHEAVRERVGLFDLTHLGKVEVTGPGALGMLQRVVTNDLSAAAVGEAMYSLVLNEGGGVIEDLIVYRLGRTGTSSPERGQRPAGPAGAGGGAGRGAPPPRVSPGLVLPRRAGSRSVRVTTQLSRRRPTSVHAVRRDPVPPPPGHPHAVR